VDIGPKTGHVYFSDASDISPERRTGDSSPSSWDTMHAYVLDLLRAKRTGRLLRYDPTKNEVQIIASGLWFANGIAVVDAEETSILVSETSMGHALQYHITGNNAGSVEVVVDSLVGIIDGADCNHNTKLCYIPIPTPITTLFTVLHSRFMPRSVDAWLRTLLMMVPSSLAPKPKKYGGVVEFSLSSPETSVTRVLQDATGENISLITGVTEYRGKLYLGGLESKFIGVYDLGITTNTKTN